MGILHQGPGTVDRYTQGGLCTLPGIPREAQAPSFCPMVSTGAHLQEGRDSGPRSRAQREQDVQAGEVARKEQRRAAQLLQHLQAKQASCFEARPAPERPALDCGPLLNVLSLMILSSNPAQPCLPREFCFKPLRYCS